MQVSGRSGIPPRRATKWTRPRKGVRKVTAPGLEQAPWSASHPHPQAQSQSQSQFMSLPSVLLRSIGACLCQEAHSACMFLRDRDRNRDRYKGTLPPPRGMPSEFHQAESVATLLSSLAATKSRYCLSALSSSVPVALTWVSVPMAIRGMDRLRSVHPKPISSDDMAAEVHLVHVLLDAMAAHTVAWILQKAFRARQLNRVEPSTEPPGTARALDAMMQAIGTGACDDYRVDVLHLCREFQAARAWLDIAAPELGCSIVLPEGAAVSLVQSAADHLGDKLTSLLDVIVQRSNASDLETTVDTITAFLAAATASPDESPATSVINSEGTPGAVNDQAVGAPRTVLGSTVSPSAHSAVGGAQGSVLAMSGMHQVVASIRSRISASGTMRTGVQLARGGDVGSAVSGTSSVFSFRSTRHSVLQSQYSSVVGAFASSSHLAVPQRRREGHRRWQKGRCSAKSVDAASVASLAIRSTLRAAGRPALAGLGMLGEGLHTIGESDDEVESQEGALAGSMGIGSSQASSVDSQSEGDRDGTLVPLLRPDGSTWVVSLHINPNQAAPVRTVNSDDMQTGFELAKEVALQGTARPREYDLRAAQSDARYNQELRAWEERDATAAQLSRENASAAELSALRADARKHLFDKFDTTPDEGTVNARPLRSQRMARLQKRVLVDPSEAQAREVMTHLGGHELDQRQTARQAEGIIDRPSPDYRRERIPHQRMRDWSCALMSPGLSSGTGSSSKSRWSEMNRASSSARWLRDLSSQQAHRNDSVSQGSRSIHSLGTRRSGNLIVAPLQRILAVAPSAAASVAMRRLGLLQAMHAIHSVSTLSESHVWHDVIDASMPPDVATAAMPYSLHDVSSTSFVATLDQALQDGLQSTQSEAATGVSGGMTIEPDFSIRSLDKEDAASMKGERTRGSDRTRTRLWTYDCFGMLSLNIRIPALLRLFFDSHDVKQLARVWKVFFCALRCSRCLDMGAFQLHQNMRLKLRSRREKQQASQVDHFGPLGDTQGAASPRRNKNHSNMMLLHAAKVSFQSLCGWLGDVSDACWGRLLRRIVQVGAGLASRGNHTVSLTPAILRQLFKQYVNELNVCIGAAASTDGGFGKADRDRDRNGGGQQAESHPARLAEAGNRSLRLLQGLLAESLINASIKSETVSSLLALRDGLSIASESLLVRADASQGGDAGAILGASTDVALQACIARASATHSEGVLRKGAEAVASLGVADAQAFAGSMRSLSEQISMCRLESMKVSNGQTTSG